MVDVCVKPIRWRKVALGSEEPEAFERNCPDQKWLRLERERS